MGVGQKRRWEKKGKHQPPSSRGKVIYLHFAALTEDFIKENGGGAGDVEGVDPEGHGDGDGLVASVEDSGADAETFAAENDAAIASEICLWESGAGRMRMRGDAADALGAKVANSFREIEFFDGRDFEDGPHGTTDRTTKPRAA